MKSYVILVYLLSKRYFQLGLHCNMKTTRATVTLKSKNFVCQIIDLGQQQNKRHKKN